MTTITETSSDLRNQAREYVRKTDLAACVDGPTSGAIPTADPFTGEVILDVPNTTIEGVGAVVARAAAAFRGPDGWREVPVEERARLLVRLSDRIDAEYDELARLESIDAGKLYSSTRGWDVGNARDVLRFYAENGPAFLAQVSEHERATSRRQPLGVIAALAPWNAPLAVGVWKVAPALLAGCTVVLKAPERAPLTTLALRRLASEVGFPDGVLNVVAGSGDTVGSALVSDERIAGISFTGGTGIAKSIVQSSSGHLPRLVLELGGKGANVVFADADIEAAAQGTAVAIFDVAGQNCCAGSRTLVEESIFEEFSARVAEIAAGMTVGDQFSDSTNMAPLIDLPHVERVAGFVRDAQSAGAEILAGGGVGGPGGTCFEPTIIRPASLSDPIWKDEVFGPVGCIAPFGSMKEAIALANDSAFGLSASVWSGDPSKLREFADAVDVGVCWTNTFGLFDIGVPWGGIKQSGFGRELSIESLNDYTSVKAIY